MDEKTIKSSADMLMNAYNNFFNSMGCSYITAAMDENNKQVEVAMLVNDFSVLYLISSIIEKVAKNSNKTPQQIIELVTKCLEEDKPKKKKGAD